MKQSITICLDSELVAQLKEEENYSNVINEQIKALYNVKQCKNLSKLQQDLKELKQEIKQKRKKQREIEQNISEIRGNEKKTLELLQKNIYSVLTRAQVDELKTFKNLDYDTAARLAGKFNLIRKNIGGVKLIKLWEELKNVRN